MATITHYRFTTPKNHNERPFIEGFRILELDNLTTTSGQAHIQTGFFDDADSVNVDKLTPLTGEIITISGAEYAALLGAAPDPVTYPTLGAQLLFSAYTAVIAHKTTEGEDWAGNLTEKD